MTAETKLPTERMGEHRFRELAGLCLKCGKCARENDCTLCDICLRAKVRRQFEQDWQEHGEKP